MAAAVVSFPVDQGATFSASLQFVSRDFTGYTFVGQIRAKAAASSPVLAVITISMAAGTVDTLVFSMSDTVTSGLPFTGASYADKTSVPFDVFATSPLGVKERLAEGYFKVSPRVSQ